MLKRESLGSIDDGVKIMKSTLSISSVHWGTLERDASRLEMSTFRYPQSDIRPTTGIQKWESQMDMRGSISEKDKRPLWLYPRHDLEAQSRFGHICLKTFALLARLAVVTYWIITDVPGIDSWFVMCLFHHAGPGLLGVETSAIVPYIFSPLPFRTLSWYHDITGVVLGTSTVLAIYVTCACQKIVTTLMTLTIIPLIFDLTIHVVTIPKHVAPV